ncbi:MAG TPA: peptidylprolyl isomerase [Actinomycetota bacterium]|jgi:peptidyl-prolyl cis-trans isomerase B (cyclophilin B)|nr:peptidylprolyl isomerase [Actinomycetota bacterium]
MSKQTRKRELDRLRARREAERARARRRRALLTYGTLGLVVLVAAVAGGLWLTGDDDSPAGATATTAAGATTTAPATQFDDARAGAPTAPAQVACGGEIPPKVDRPTFSKRPTTKVDPAKTYEATFRTSCGRFTVRLDAKKAPITTANFVFLAGKKFYDSTWFHRIVPGGAAGIAVIQGGDPEGSGRGGPGYAIKDELPPSPAAYKQYSVAMANSGPDSGGSQFFISFQDNSQGLQANYSVFGEVTEGRDVIDKIAKVPVGGQTGDTPQQSVWIERVTVKAS